MKYLIALVYFALGVFFCALLPDTAGRPFGMMVLLWPIFVPLIALFWILDKIFSLGEFIRSKVKGD